MACADTLEGGPSFAAMSPLRCDQTGSSCPTLSGVTCTDGLWCQPYGSPVTPADCAAEGPNSSKRRGRPRHDRQWCRNDVEQDCLEHGIGPTSPGTRRPQHSGPAGNVVYSGGKGGETPMFIKKSMLLSLAACVGLASLATNADACTPNPDRGPIMVSAGADGNPVVEPDTVTACVGETLRWVFRGSTAKEFAVAFTERGGFSVRLGSADGRHRDRDGQGGGGQGQRAHRVRLRRRTRRPADGPEDHHRALSGAGVTVSVRGRNGLTSAGHRRRSYGFS